MLKFLTKLILLAVVILVAGIYLTQWKLKDDLASFAKTIKPWADFSYTSAKVNFSGDIQIHTIKLYVEAIASEVEIGELNLSFGNFYRLIRLKSRLAEGKLPDSVKLKLNKVLLPLNQKVINAFKQTEPATGFQLLQSAFCGKTEAFDIQTYDAMGYSYMAFSTEGNYSLDPYSGNLVVKGYLDLENAFQSEFQANINGLLSWFEQVQQASSGRLEQEPTLPNLSLFEISLLDRGYNQRVADYCARQELKPESDYYAQHVAQLDKMLLDSGLVLTPQFKQLYSEAIQPESKISLFLKPRIDFEFKGIRYYDYEQLLNLSGFKLKINGKSVDKILDGWSYPKLTDIQTRHQQAKLKALESQNSYQSVVISKEFKPVAVANAARFVDYPSRVTRNDGTMFEGKLEKVSEGKLWVKVRSKEGVVTLPVATKAVRKLEIYQEVKTIKVDSPADPKN